jgi:hypothetical protein
MGPGSPWLSRQSLAHRLLFRQLIRAANNLVGKRLFVH